jgi:hypothetical protein
MAAALCKFERMVAIRRKGTFHGWMGTDQPASWLYGRAKGDGRVGDARGVYGE